MQKKEIYRQGDVLIQRVSFNVPIEAEKLEQDNGRVILAYGENTGHAHAIDGKLAERYQWQGDVLLDVKEQAYLRHEEHSAIKLEPGTYKIIHQREYVPGSVRRVAD